MRGKQTWMEWKTWMEIKAELVGAIYPKAWAAASSNGGEFWEVSSGLPLGQGEFWSRRGLWVPCMCPRGSSQGRNRQILSPSTSTLHSGKARVIDALEGRSERGQVPSLVPASSRTAVLDVGSLTSDPRESEAHPSPALGGLLTLPLL